MIIEVRAATVETKGAYPPYIMRTESAAAAEYLDKYKGQVRDRRNKLRKTVLR